MQKEFAVKKFIRPLISTHEFLNGKNRWCLWLKDASPSEMRAMPEVLKRVNAVREFRLKSKKPATVKLADIPYLFAGEWLNRRVQEVSQVEGISRIEMFPKLSLVVAVDKYL